ncbi:MAG: sodium:solute symporter family protein [Microscillaceae bacterium]|nr:sodium:solute symporter family protein [Microscillaceae bacterium]MDW8461584.1 sodium:solute symporter family protein [Cytophagales bacterium]
MLVFFITLYIIFTIGIGYYASSKVQTATDFALAGRQLPLSISATSLFATWFGAEVVLGASAEFATKGVLGIIEEPLGAVLALTLIGLFFSRPLYRLNIYTFGDFFRLRFGQTAEWLSSLIMVLSYFGWIAAQFVALGGVIHTILGILTNYAVLIGAVIVLVYTYIGGMWAISLADFIQTIVILIGLLLILAIFLAKIPDFSVVIQAQPKGFFNFLPENTWHGWLHYLTAWLTIGLGGIPSQDIFQRIMSAKSEKVAVRMAYLASVMYLFLTAVPLIIVLIIKYLYPEYMQGDTEMLLPKAIVEHTPVYVQIAFFGALISAIMSTASGTILAPATILAENILRPIFKVDTDSKMLTLLRSSVVIVALISLILAYSKANIFALASMAGAIGLVSLFTSIVAGLYVTNCSSLACLVSMVTGLMVWAILEIWATDLITSTLAGFLISIATFIIVELYVRFHSKMCS